MSFELSKNPDIEVFGKIARRCPKVPLEVLWLLTRLPQKGELPDNVTCLQIGHVTTDERMIENTIQNKNTYMYKDVVLGKGGFDALPPNLQTLIIGSVNPFCKEDFTNWIFKFIKPNDSD